MFARSRFHQNKLYFYPMQAQSMKTFLFLNHVFNIKCVIGNAAQDLEGGLRIIAF